MIESDAGLAAKAVIAVNGSLSALKESTAWNGGIALEKGKDIKLEADIVMSSELCSRLTQTTSIRSISEEEIETHCLPQDEPIWIVDPLDGSMNFSRGLPLYCVSVALWRNGKPVIGIIYDVERDRSFCANGGQAWVDDRELRVSAVEDISRAVLATGFPLHSDVSTEAVRWFLDFAKRFKKVRMLGTAALSLAWVAEGRLDAYFERDIMLWDVAAGAALVRAAGGLCIMLPGRHPMSFDVLAANPQLTAVMKELLEW
jgi:myo-inositol-1(or 4)-monophosphatase